MDEELDLLDLFFAFWKKRVLIVIIVLIGAAFGFLYTRYMVVPKYTSSVTLILGRQSEEGKTSSLDNSDTITQSDIALNQKLISTYGEILKSKRVSKAVIENLNLNMTYAQLKRCVSVSSVKDTDVIKLSITTKDPETSAQIADEMTKVFIEEIERIYNIKNVSVIDSAEVDYNPVNVSYAKNVVILGAIAFVLVAVVIFLIYYFDNTIKTEENIAKVVGLPVLATIPDISLEKKGGKK